jgi:hypothetical protein
VTNARNGRISKQKHFLTPTYAKWRHCRRKRIESLTSTDPEILELSKTEYHNPHHPHPAPIEPYIEPEAYRQLHELRAFIARWSKDWGPITGWPHTLKELHGEAVERNDVEEWYEELDDKVRRGLGALYELKALFLELPTRTPWMIRDIWCQAFELAGEIHRCIACIQAHIALYDEFVQFVD